MSEEQKKVAKIMTEAIEALPDSKKEYLLGYAEGVLAASKQQNATNPSGGEDAS